MRSLVATAKPTDRSKGPRPNEGPGLCSMSPPSKSRRRSHLAATRPYLAEATTKSKGLVCPDCNSSSQRGISLVGGSTGRSRDGPSDRFLPEEQWRSPGYMFPNIWYPTQPFKTREMAAELERPFAAAPIVTRESRRAATREFGSDFETVLMKLL